MPKLYKKALKKFYNKDSNFIKQGFKVILKLYIAVFQKLQL